jgi:hypothetical protein
LRSKKLILLYDRRISSLVHVLIPFSWKIFCDNAEIEGPSGDGKGYSALCQHWDNGAGNNLPLDVISNADMRL